MGHVTRDREKLLHRVRRIRGQLNAVEKAIEDEQACATVLQTLVACRGAMNSLMAEVMEDHIRAHAFRAAKPKSEESAAADDLVDVVRTYLK